MREDTVRLARWSAPLVFALLLALVGPGLPRSVQAQGIDAAVIVQVDAPTPGVTVANGQSVSAQRLGGGPSWYGSLYYGGYGLGFGRGMYGGY